MLSLQHLLRFSIWTSKKGLPIKECLSCSWWHSTEEFSLYLRISMTYAVKEQKITKKHLLTFKIITWPKFLHVNAQFQTEVVTLNWTCATLTFFMPARWISNVITTLMTCSINTDLENSWPKQKIKRKLMTQTLPIHLDSMLVSSSCLWLLSHLICSSNETTLTSWTTSSSTSLPDPLPTSTNSCSNKKKTRTKAPQSKPKMSLSPSVMSGKISLFRKQLNNLLPLTLRSWKLIKLWVKLERRLLK